MRTKIVLSFLLCLVSSVIYSQINPDWVTTYNGLGTTKTLDKSKAMAIDLSGNIYVTGESYGQSNNLDYLTIKINPAGDTLWTRRYNGTADSIDVATDIAVDILGNVFVTGRSLGDTTDWDYVTIKYNTLGDLGWVARFSGISPVPGGFSQDLARSICVDGLGNCYVTGVSTITYNSDDMLTIKYNSSGTEEWVNRFNGPLSVSDQAYSVEVDNLGNVYVCGYVDGAGGLGVRDYCTIKYNSSGVQEWLARYNGSDNRDDEARIVGLDNFGNVYITGVSTSLSTYIDYLTIKYNSAGVEQWISRYTYSSLDKEDTPRDMVVDDAGNCYITGMSRSDQNWAGFGTVKYNSLGVELWTNRFDVYHSEDAYGIALDAYGNVYVSGESNGDTYTIAYTSIGSEIWNSRFTNPGLSQEFVSDIVVDTSLAGTTKVYVSGSYENAVQDANYIILKYSSVSSDVEDKNLPTLNSFSLNQNYPNPFNPNTTISYSIPNAAKVELKVFNLLGQEITTLVNQEKPAGNYEVNFNASNLPSGIYIYKMKAGEYVQTRKMVLLK